MKRSSKPIAQRSAKKVQRDQEYKATHAAVLDRDSHRCQFHRRPLTTAEMGVYGDVCGNGDLHVHHIRRRSQGGTDDPSNLVTLCATHHKYVHDHPALSREMGLLEGTAA